MILSPYRDEMTKILDYPGYDAFGNVTNDIIRPKSSYLLKTADARTPELMKFVDKLLADLSEEDKGKFVYFINSALGAYDHWGVNANGDSFEKEWLLKNQDQDEADRNSGKYKGIIMPHYKTFLQGNAFLHHKNNDPKRKIGDVLGAFFNHNMNRPDLIVRIRRTPELKTYCDRLDSGEPVETSMGWRCQGGDHCSICGNNATRREDYCDHLKYHMNEIMPDGRVVCAFNRRGRFFDISIVNVNADKSSFALMKIAKKKYNLIKFASTNSVSFNPAVLTPEFTKLSTVRAEEELGMNLKQAYLTKKSDIIKRIKSLGSSLFPNPEELKEKLISLNIPNNSVSELNSVSGRASAASMPEEKNPDTIEFFEPGLTEEILEGLTRFPLKQVLATSAQMGIILKEKEFAYLYNMSKDKDVNFDKIDYNPVIENILKDVVPLRSYKQPYLNKRASVIKNNPEFVKKALFGFGGSNVTEKDPSTLSTYEMEEMRRRELPGVNYAYRDAAAGVASDIKKGFIISAAIAAAYKIYLSKISSLKKIKEVFKSFLG